MKRAALVVCSLLLTGCVTQSLGLGVGERLRPTSPSTIELFDSDPARPHETIGKVHAHCRTDWLAAAFNCNESSLREALRDHAATLGADAVVSITRTSFWQFEWTDIHLRGRAVRWAARPATPASPTLRR